MSLETSTVNSTTETNKSLDTKGLFDETGRLIPQPGQRVYSQKSRRYFVTGQPDIDYKKIHTRIQKHLNTGDAISAEEFQSRAEAILEKLKADEKMQGLLSGVHVPFFCTPNTDKLEYGELLENSYIKAVGEAYVEMYPKYTFTNYCEGQLKDQTTLFPGTRYEQFVEAHNAGVVVGWYFVNCLAEFGVPDQRELVKDLPEGAILSGPIEAAAAFIGSPDILMKTDTLYPHLLALLGVQPKSEKEKHFFYFFEAYGWNLTFNKRSYIGAVSEYYAGGLTFLG